MVDVILYNKLIAELGGPEKVKVVSREARPNFKLLGCNHCVACCDPEVPTLPCSLRHLAHLVHHALPNLPAKRRPGILSLSPLADASALADRAYRASGETESAHGLPSMLRRRRQRGRLPDLAPVRLPRAYTNIPDYYSELLVVQHEFRKQGRPAQSTTNSGESGSITAIGTGEGDDLGGHPTSRFRVLDYLGHEQSGQNTLAATHANTATAATRATTRTTVVTEAAAAGSLKRSFSDLMDYGSGEVPLWHKKLARSISASSSESSEFSFDAIYPDGDVGEGGRAAFGGSGGEGEPGMLALERLATEEVRYPAKMRFKNLLASYRKLGEIIQSRGYGLALTS